MKRTPRLVSKSKATSPLNTSLTGRQAEHVDSGEKKTSLMHIRRVVGQVEGVQRMVEEDRYCVDIIMQITAARASLLTIAKELLEQHLKRCHLKATKNGGKDVDAMYQELVDLVAKMSR